MVSFVSNFRNLRSSRWLNGCPRHCYSPMRRGTSGSGLTPNSLVAPVPCRRSSAVELYSSHGQYSNTSAGLSGASLGNSLGGYYGSIGGSRSAATSPVGGASANICINKDPHGGSSTTGGSGASTSGGSPRHNKTSNEAWVCPNDRQLALRAK